jgi:hypothetical protein
MSADPRSEYRARLQARRATAQQTEERTRRLANARLGAFALGGLVVWAVIALSLSLVWILLPIAAFIALVVLHDRSRRDHEVARRAVRYYELGLSRLDYRFAGTGDGGERFADPVHPYADHLDLFGSGGLFELINCAQTEAGVETLARWLKHPAPAETVRQRQAAVEELRGALDLREDFWVLGPEVQKGLDPAALVRWGEAPSRRVSWLLRGIAFFLSLAAVAAVAVIPLFGLVPLVAVAAVELALALPTRKRVRQTAADVDQALRQLSLLEQLLKRVERESFEAPLLLELRAELDTRGVPPSEQIRRLRQRAELLRQRRNQFFAPISPFLLWTTQLAFSIEAWRAHCGPHLDGWIRALGALEALADLSGYAYEHPDDPFPELVDDETVFEAEALGHPLLPEETCVRNDLRLAQEPALFVVSGSNMSGKSTLLRTVGTNCALALAGAPVRAQRLRMAPLQVGASIVVNDSLQEGASRFYAEITRLRGIVDLCDRELPVLYLLDEILGGTNSHDRRVGAEALVRGLIDRGALGLLTTHDLALAQIADQLAPRAANVHFEDQLVDGQMNFDYQLRPGVVTHSNALELMRAVGLDV